MSGSTGLSGGRWLAYVAGTAGWTITDRLIVTFALFFYLPPAGHALAARIEERSVLGLTVFGALMLLGRIVDAVADPLVAAWSDRSRARLGRRRVFLLWGAVPLAAATLAVFMPPAAAATAGNAVYLGAALALFFVLFTLYVTPYLALIPEIARAPAARLRLTTAQAFAQLAGAMVVMLALPVWIARAGGGAPAYRGGIGAACAVAAALLLTGALGAGERGAGGAAGEQPGLRRSLRLTFGHRPFRLYLVGTIAYWFAFNIVSAAALYFTTVLMGAGEDFQATAFGATFAVAGGSFALWGAAGRRWGKRRAMLAAGAGFIVALGALAAVGGKASGVLAFALLGVPVGALLVIPNAMLADCADDDARRTGSRREAMFFGAQGVLLKVNLGLSTAVLAGLLAAFGRDPGNDLGLRLAGPVAAAVVGAGLWCFARYPEQALGHAGGKADAPPVAG